MKDIKTVLFDLDDTLLDRTNTFALYYDHLITTFFPRDISPDEKHEIKQYLKLSDKNGYEKREFFYQNIILKWRLPYSAEQLENEWLENFHRFSVPERNLINVLEYLSSKKYKLGIVTNGLTLMQNGKIDTLGIRSFFQTIVISSDVGMRKPDKEIFLFACKSLDTDASNTVFIGDNYQVDIIGSTQAGLRAIWFKKFSENETFPCSIEKLASLTSLL